MENQKTALVIVLSLAHNDPRVRRQLTWLKSDGWTIDTIGIGPTPSDEVRDHFELRDPTPWTATKWGAVLSYRLLPKRQMFRRLTVDRIAPEVLHRIANGEYRLILFNDMDFLPLLEDPAVFTPAAFTSQLHLDIHEYRDRTPPLTAWRILALRYYRWQRGLIASPALDARTTVASRIADFYVEDFGIEPPTLVRNIPPFHDQEPSPVNPAKIRMLFHGLASWARGFDEILDAMKVLDDRFEMTFMLTGNPKVVASLRERIAEFGDRVRLVPPVPMTELSKTVNQYDLEVMFYPPVSRNVEFALPNKFFEAVQGRLGLVVGKSPMMAELVERHGLGIVVDGWTAEDLAAALTELTPERIMTFKKNAHAAAAELNAEHEGDVFLAALNVDGKQRP